ncbi:MULTISPECIES: TonB-dependent receptor [unclassified Novosphingobium]|uniref:TonB-dependent receptor n=1 Tax=unclassified Novosphingobium TaxID=2644732 RepID=UPI001447A865|nr:MULTISPECIES: TonB-dependent receptor [unclassified Novosphingobium]NKJ45021.1 outer membrane receptor protein involved in Fe transport [Novosphingobium sp. SG720]NMN07612.1 outer membrane receptor protein involved in Fe transport [Novosphingobium sp. SG919]NMN89922.1 outer membrane receptor protein involved in Fe transport [Novosphingobium sp. SG916]
MKTYLLLSTCVLASALAVPAHAQTAVSARPDINARPATVEEIVVTAQRRAENLQNVPISVTAVSAMRLSSAGITNAQALATVTPALTVNNASGYFLPKIRGIGASTFGPGLENSIAVYVDNVYYAASSASLFSFNNIERVEVLKGPQGTLFGRNATGGLINIVTKDPSRTPGGSASLSYGNYQTLSGSLYLTTGLSDNAAIDISFVGSHQGKGFGTNLATGRDVNKTDSDIGLRSKLLWEPGPNTAIRLSGDYSQTRGNNPAFRDFPGEQPLFGLARTGSPWDVNTNVEPKQNSSSGGAAMRIDQGLGSIQLVSISAYRSSTTNFAFDFDLTPVPALGIFVKQNDRQFSQELQLQSNKSSYIKWVLGGFYFHGYSAYVPSDLVIGFPLDQPGSPFFPFSRMRTTGTVKTDSYAGYGQVTVPVGPSTNITGGLRYTSERRSIDGMSSAQLPDGSFIDLLPPGTGNQSKQFNKLTWRVSVDHKINNILLYASYNRGFKAGGFNLGTPEQPAFEPEVLDAYEAGLKMDLLDRRLRFNPAIFYYDYTNIQVPKPLPTGTVGIVNGPSAKIYGLDIDGEAIISSRMKLNFGATVIHDRFGDFPNALMNTPNPAGGVIQTLFNARGNRIPVTADFSTSLGGLYTLPVGAGDMVFSVDWNHNDGYFTNVDNLRRQKSFEMVNASITFNTADERFSLRGWVRNIGNEAVLLYSNSSNTSSVASYGAPRTYGLTLQTKF